MNTEKLQVVFNDGQTDLTVREGKAIDLLPLKAPVKINISGIINAPLLFLEKRFDILNNCRNQYPGNECEENQLEPTRCHVIVEREGYKITLVTNENNEYTTGKVASFHSVVKSTLPFAIAHSNITTETRNTAINTRGLSHLCFIYDFSLQ